MYPRELPLKEHMARELIRMYFTPVETPDAYYDSRVRVILQEDEITTRLFEEITFRENILVKIEPFEKYGFYITKKRKEEVL
jgi:hypothetical protein